jgi:hypothetical protein
MTLFYLALRDYRVQTIDNSNRGINIAKITIHWLLLSDDVGGPHVEIDYD